jgi:protocatechuate 3,4-dioxygenase alpha subunit
MPSALTPSQTIGPFFHEGMRWATTSAAALPAGSVVVAGRVLDRDAAPVSDAVLEVWQPGVEAGGPLQGLQRVVTDDTGRFAFLMPAPGSGQVHAHVSVFARGLLRGLFTRVYLRRDGDASALALPAAVPAERRATLVARPGAADAGPWEWDVRLSGTGETVFFDL